MNPDRHLSEEVSDLLFKYAFQQGLTEDHPILLRLRRLIKEKSFDTETWITSLDELAIQTNNPALGLDIGQLAEPKHAGVMGYLINSSDNLAMAGMQFGRYQELLYGNRAAFEIEGSAFKVVWPVIGIEFSRSDECLLSAFVKVINLLTDRQLDPLEVGFRQEEPSYANRYHEIFGSNVKFSRNQPFIKYPLEYLDIKITSKDLVIQKLLKEQAESLLATFSQKDEFEIKLHKAVIESIKLGEVTINKTAEILSISTRSLQRNLQEKTTNYSEVLRNCRKELALNYFKDKSLSLTEISFLLGYSEQSVFTRAFKSWFGVLPKNYRNKA